MTSGQHNPCFMRAKVIQQLPSPLSQRCMVSLWKAAEALQKFFEEDIALLMALRESSSLKLQGNMISKVHWWQARVFLSGRALCV